MSMLSKLLKVAAAFSRSLWFNLRYLPFRHAVKLPVWLAPNVRVKRMWRGGILLSNPRFNSCHIGFHVADAVDCYGTHTILCVERGGLWNIKDDVHIGRGAIIHVKSAGNLNTGRNFAVSGTTSIVCSDRVTIGDDVQFSWNTLVMDSDAHQLFGENGNQLNPSAPITIGNNVWVAANCTILKKAVIGDNCVVAGNSMVNRPIEGDNRLIGGIPARPLKKITGWHI